RPGVGDGIVERARVHIAAEANRATPNDQPIAGPDEGMSKTAVGRSGEGGRSPGVCNWIVATATVKKVESVISAPDDHFVSRPYGRVAFASGWRVGGGGCRPYIR